MKGYQVISTSRETPTETTNARLLRCVVCVQTFRGQPQWASSQDALMLPGQPRKFCSPTRVKKLRPTQSQSTFGTGHWHTVINVWWFGPTAG